MVLNYQKYVLKDKKTISHFIHTTAFAICQFFRCFLNQCRLKIMKNAGEAPNN